MDAAIDESADDGKRKADEIRSILASTPPRSRIHKTGSEWLADDEFDGALCD